MQFLASVLLYLCVDQTLSATILAKIDSGSKDLN